MSNLVVKENIIYKKRDYGGLLVNPECGEKTFLNATAFRILQLFDGSNTVEDIIQQLSEEWEVDTEELRGDITEIVTDFQELGVLVAYTGDTQVQYTGAVLDSAAVEVTSRCNLCCKHCLRRASPHEGTELNFDVICDIIHQLACMQVFDLVLTGGEPFLRPDFCDILAYAQERMLCTVFTNGTLMTDEHIQRLQEIQPHLIQVSLDGATSETHNVIRGPGTFEKTVKTIKKLVKAELPVKISMTLSKFNFHEYAMIVDFAKKLGVLYLDTAEMLPQGRALTFKEFCLSLEETTEFKNYYYEKILTEKDINIGGEQSLDFLRDPFNPGNPTDRDLCHAFRDSLAVKADGAVVPCLSFDEHDFHMGSILDQSVSDIWNSPEYESLRTVSVAGCQVCSDCIYRRICGGGCRARAYQVSGDLRGPPEHIDCESRKALYSFAVETWKPGATIEEFYQSMERGE